MSTLGAMSNGAIYHGTSLLFTQLTSLTLGKKNFIWGQQMRTYIYQIYIIIKYNICLNMNI